MQNNKFNDICDVICSLLQKSLYNQFDFTIRNENEAKRIHEERD